VDDIDLHQIQLHPGGEWHRRNRVDRCLTACGEYILGPVKSRDHGTTRENHTCRICWPDDNADTAEMKKLQRNSIAWSDAEAYFDEDEEPTNPEWGKDEDT
jgi:hypothetical protein